ncbi:MAG: hypothetical protein SFY81_05310 [Verrucomicrobiota bacterium]|nr:hypothetical protein [Verrucomicrobiota bacterium]
MNGYVGAQKPVRWASAVKAGALVGSIFVLVARGIPWASSGLISPTMMGFELKHPGAVDAGATFITIVLHMATAILYAVLMAPVINRFRYWYAVPLGGVIGFLLYLLNSFLLSEIFTNAARYSRELPAAITHVAFGLAAAAAYKGFARSRNETAQRGSAPVS